MTGKRFRSGLAKNDEFSDEIIDELTGKHYFDSTKDDYVFSEEIVDLLNKIWEQTQRFEKHNKDLTEENEKLKEQLSEAKADEKQLGISFMGYKMKLIEVLQKKYDKVKGKTLYADVYTEIAEEMGVDLE